MTAVETRALRKDYGHHTAVHALDLSVEPGSVVGLIGPNGAGKSTVIRTLLDLLRPTSGEVRVLGQDPRAGGPALRRRIGYLPGDARMSGRESGRSLLRHLERLSGPVAPGSVDALAERLGADLTRPVKQLSKGNRQKVGLIQAFMHRPELLILDEPTSGLDPLVQREFLAMIREARDAGQTVLLSSHVLTEIQQAADDVVVLADGRVVARGDVASLRLGGAAHLHAVLADATPAQVRDLLADVPGARDVSVDPAADGTVRLGGTVSGDVDALVKALARTTVRHLTLEEPDLEQAVLGLYSDAKEEDR